MSAPKRTIYIGRESTDGVMAPSPLRNIVFTMKPPKYVGFAVDSDLYGRSRRARVIFGFVVGVLRVAEWLVRRVK